MLQHIASEVVHSLSNNTSTGRKYPRRDQGSWGEVVGERWIWVDDED